MRSLLKLLLERPGRTEQELVAQAGWRRTPRNNTRMGRKLNELQREGLVYYRYVAGEKGRRGRGEWYLTLEGLKATDPVPCGGCGGTGYQLDPDANPVPCPSCDGLGHQQEKMR